MESDVYERMYKRWLDMMNAFDVGQRGSNFPSTEAVYEIWAKNFRSIFEGTFRFPPFKMVEGLTGVNIGADDEYWQLSKAYGDLFKQWADLSVDFAKAWIEGTGNATLKLNKVRSSTQAEYAKESYNLLVGELERSFDALLRGTSFSAKLGSFISSVLEVKKRNDLVMERYYSRLNLPTKSELDRVHREIYELRKKVGDLSKETMARARKP